MPGNPDDGTELFIVFAVGVNDSAVTTGTDDFLVERGAYDTNMRELASLASQDADGRVLIVGPTPINEALTKPIPYRPEREYRQELVETYNDIARRAAQDEGVRFVNLFNGLQPHDGHWNEWDGVHLNSDAHQRVARLIDPEPRRDRLEAKSHPHHLNVPGPQWVQPAAADPCVGRAQHLAVLGLKLLPCVVGACKGGLGLDGWCRQGAKADKTRACVFVGDRWWRLFSAFA